MSSIFTREFRGRTYNVRIWNGEPVPKASLCSMDTETELIIPGRDIVPVILQVAYDTGIVDIVSHKIYDQYLSEFHRINPDIPIAMHNAGFDLEVLGWKKIPWLEEAINTGRILDTGGRFYLRQLAKGLSPKEYPGLGDISKSLFKQSLDKDGSTRCSYLRGMKMTPAHIAYAAEDAIVTLAAVEYMEAMPTELEQMWMTVASQELQINGMLVDMDRFRKLRTKFNKKLEEHLAILNVFGYIPGASGNKKVLQEILEMIEEREGVKFRRTAKSGDISTSDDYLVGIDVKHPFLDAYKQYVHIHKMVGTYLNDEYVGEDGRVHPYFNSLVRSGRTSCRSPNIQNVPGDEGLRGIYVAPEGSVLAAVDYDQIELCALAESNYLRFGYSKQGDMINNDRCCHCDISSQLHGMTYEELWTSWKAGDKEAKKIRQFGKIPNFGLPGGLGGGNLSSYARGYGINDMTSEQGIHIREVWLETYPEMQEHLEPPVDQYWTRRNILEYCENGKIQLPEYSEGSLKNYLREKFEEAGEENPGRAAFMEMKDLIRYTATTVRGRVRSNCTFTSACNTVFQGLTADGAKRALWRLIKARYKIVNFVHDEIIVELKDDEHLQYHIREIERIMVEAMKEVITRVKISVESTLMRRWDKGARNKYLGDDLQIWEEKEDFEGVRVDGPLF